jgi:hypothetical protein
VVTHWEPPELEVLEALEVLELLDVLDVVPPELDDELAVVELEPPGQKQPGTAWQTSWGSPSQIVNTVPVHSDCHEQPCWPLHVKSSKKPEHDSEIPEHAPSARLH